MRFKAFTGVLMTMAVCCNTYRAEAGTARSVNDFLDSIGACVHVQHHQDAGKLADSIKFTGLRNVRDGADNNFDMTGLLLIHRNTGAKVCFGPGSGAKDVSLEKTMIACKTLAGEGALLAIEGPNEPNNFGGVTYQGKNSSKLKSWLPVAHYQADFYSAVKSDPMLKEFAVLGVSEAGAEDDNCGLQFAKIPVGSQTLMPDGTVYCDYINCHNYVCGHIKGQIDNQATLAASVNPKAAIDHLFGNHGKTWRKKFAGYTEKELASLPKATTETGWKSDNTPAGDDLQGKMLLNVFLAQFNAGWKYTFIYEFADDSDGAFGFYKSDLITPRKSATYLHNLTSILADTGQPKTLGTLDYTITNQPGTVHDLLLQKADGTFELAIWGEAVNGDSQVVIQLNRWNSMVNVYDPTVGTDAVQKLSKANSVSLTMSDHVQIIEVR